MPGPTSPSAVEIDKWSIRLCVQSGLAANGWTGNSVVPVKLATNGWPKAEEISTPSVYVGFSEHAVAGIELGSHGKRRNVQIEIYAPNDPAKERLAEEITNLFRDDKVKILNFVTGQESAPEAVGRYELDEVGWRSIPMPAVATEVDRYRARVSATLRRADA